MKESLKHLRKFVPLLLFFLSISSVAFAQEVSTGVDSLAVDSLSADTLAVSPKKKGSWLKRAANNTANFSKKQFDKVEKALKLDDASIEAAREVESAH